MSVAATMQLALRDAFLRRDSPGHALARDSTRVAEACQAMADRFRRGGKLIAFGNGGAGADAAHIAVEFMHPVTVGKRALPALALSNDAATMTAIGVREGLAETFAHQLAHWAAPHDIALGISRDGRCANVLRALRTAADRGLLTVALLGDVPPPPQEESPRIDADHVLLARSTDPAVVKEIHVTAYHLLWELAHLFLEHPAAQQPADDTQPLAQPHTQPWPVAAEQRPPACGDTCTTCADQATPATVVQLLDGGLALADTGTGTGTEEISVALVDAAVGDTVLVHAGEAIAVITKGTDHGRR
ncbi:SIS domain-containing protein [Microtetraspora malaysiensis]|uniref:SIS domain-containing protein n=1 Tax=Microtetraspora malaysiensis TaxID=161358 RepID=A0ABW6SKY3_9ACTN